MTRPDPAGADLNNTAAPAPAVGAAAAPLDHEHLPPLYQDRSFWGMTATQLLGAFNDSVFKQIILLLCVTVMVSSSSQTVDKQFVAQAIFALAFILFSGIGGYWSDRTSKRSIIVACKIAEIAVMALAVAAFSIMAAPVAVTSSGSSNPDYLIAGVPWLLMAVLFLMGTQSALFGPAKYGILPEMVRAKDLPRMNGMIQMTTFVALILGTWVGGILIDQFHQDLWVAGTVCVGIAAVGTLTSLAVRRTPIAQPGAAFHWSSLAVAPDTWSLLRVDATLRRALWVYSLFWFVASIFPMAVNWLGKVQFGLSGEATSFMLATVSIGIAGGFILAGRMSAERMNFGLVRIGSLGLIVTMVLLSIPTPVAPQSDAAPGARSADAATLDGTTENGTASAPATDTAVRWEPALGRWGCQVLLVIAGFFAGLFALPVQVFLQSRPPDRIKGRVIGTMNLVNWIAMIIAAVVFYPLVEGLLEQAGLPKFAMFGVTGLFLLPVAIFYRPSDVDL